MSTKKNATVLACKMKTMFCCFVLIIKKNTRIDGSTLWHFRLWHHTRRWHLLAIFKLHGTLWPLSVSSIAVSVPSWPLSLSSISLCPLSKHTVECTSFACTALDLAPITRTRRTPSLISTWRVNTREIFRNPSADDFLVLGSSRTAIWHFIELDRSF